MDLSFDEKLDRYADIIVRVGLNLQTGQRLLIGVPTALTPLESAPLVRRVAAHAYDAGAALVDVLWGDDRLDRIRLDRALPHTLDTHPAWPIDATLDIVRNADARLVIHSKDPDLFDGVDPQRLQRATHSMISAIKPIVALNPAHNTNWLVAAYPVQAWAQRVFPEASPEQAVDRLWQAIFAACRVDTPDPTAAWRAHSAGLAARAAALNRKQYTALHLTGPGADLTVGLPAGHIWAGGGSVCAAGISFIPNFPTEEVFTLPHRERVDGRVAATRPFSFAGSRIDGATFTFSAGKVVDFAAEHGGETLRSLIETDSGSCRLGEVALTPHSSPVSQTGLLFHNELFDENAASHLALGRAYRDCLEGGPAMSIEEFTLAGGNHSDVHNDFMVGSAALDVDGVLPGGGREAVMRRGEWAFALE